MKKYVLLFTLLSSFVNAQNITFSDVNFKNALVNTNCVDSDNNGTGEADVDTDNDNEIQVSEALSVTRLLIFGQNISNLSGIENFSNLQKLDCSNNNLTSLNFQNNSIISSLFCSNNQITNLTLTNLPNLTNFSCSSNLIQSLDLSTTGFVQGEFGGNPNLQYINLRNNVINNCIVFPFTGSDYTCIMFLNCPALQLVCLDANEISGYYSYFPQQNVQFSSDANCVLSSESFNKNNVTLYPNPVKNELNFSFEKSINIEKINIYNTLGQLIKKFSGTQNSINLSDLNSGYYHIEFISNEGKLMKKFIKE